jgi:competence protein ComEA
VERPYPWRVLEDAVPPAPIDPPPGAGPQPSHPADRSGLAAGRRQAPAAEPGLSRRLLAVLAALVAAIAAGTVAIALAGAASPTLVLPGDGGTAADVGRLVASMAPDATSAAPAGAPLVVDVAGAVRKPGVYRLPGGSRVVDAIAAAGGYGPRVDAAAASQLNLAAPVRDGEQIRVPSRDDAAAGGTGSAGGGSPAATGSAGGAASPVNVNTATAEELDTLPGIGPATAAKIIAAREEAPFATVAELRSRGVVGEATFHKLEALVTVGR